MGFDRGADWPPYDRAQAIVAWAHTAKSYVEGRSWREFGAPLDEVTDDAFTWLAIVWSWLADGLANNTFGETAAFYERVKWGTEMRPDRYALGDPDPAPPAQPAVNPDGSPWWAAYEDAMNEPERPAL